MVVELCKPEDKHSLRSYHGDWAALFRTRTAHPLAMGRGLENVA